MPVTTHGPRCRTRFCRPSRCGDCGAGVYYWSCTCGSKVLFDELGDPWPIHQCTHAESSSRRRSKGAAHDNVKPISTYTYGVLSTVCPRCWKPVRNREM